MGTYRALSAHPKLNPGVNKYLRQVYVPTQRKRVLIVTVMECL